MPSEAPDFESDVGVEGVEVLCILLCILLFRSMSMDNDVDAEARVLVHPCCWKMEDNTSEVV